AGAARGLRARERSSMVEPPKVTRPTSPAPSGARVPRWALASSATAPVAMIGGWLLAESRQPDFDPVLETISALAATDAVDPWVMTAGLAVTGIAHVVTALGLRPVPTSARAVHAV